MSDTTDIVQKLRRRAHNGIQPMNELARLDMLAAATEITRLRAALMTASRQLGEWADAMRKTVDERDRLRAALAQAGAGREPIGYMNEGHLHELKKGRLPYGYVYPSAAVGAETPIYTAHPSPAQREPLSDEQIDSAPALTLAEYSVRVGRHELRQFARQIEAACAAAWGVKLTGSSAKGAAS